MTGRDGGGRPTRREGVRETLREGTRPALEEPRSGPRLDGGALVEVEELPTHSLSPRSRTRLPVTGAIALGALAVLLAAGFGLLGGRQGEAPVTPQGSQLAGLPLSSVPATDLRPVPRVTPWAPCSGPPDQPPEPVLEVDGRQYFGRVELVDAQPGQDFEDIPHVIGEANLLDAVEVRMDAVSEIWIPGGSCAVAWSIGLAEATGSTDPQLQLLESVANEARDPAVAAQNRFQVFVAPFAGEHRLEAILVLEHVTVAATWAIRVPPLEPPTVSLRAAGGRTIPTVIGCDVTQRLANNWEQPLSRCARDVVREPSRRVGVAPNEPLDFEIDGWAATNTIAYCGQLADRRFTPQTEPTCLLERDLHVAGVRFPAPDEAGPWSLAISGCATRIRVTGRGFEELCGTWYANVRVRD